MLAFSSMNYYSVILYYAPSVLRHCWLGGRKGIRPVKNWVVGGWHGYVSGSRCRFAYGPADAIATHYLLLQQIQIGVTFLVLPVWWQLTQVVPERIQEGHKMAVCMCVCVCACVHACVRACVRAMVCDRQTDRHTHTYDSIYHASITELHSIFSLPVSLCNLICITQVPAT